MKNVRSSERDKDGKVITTAAPAQIEALQAQTQEDLQVNKTVQEMDTGPLYKRVYHRHDLSHEDYVDAAIELHQRFALPLACVLLALVGIPLGISSQKGGKSAAFVLTVLLAFLYYLGYITLIGLAKKGSLPVPVAVWTPDAVFLIVGVVLLSRLEKPGDRDLAAWTQAFVLRIVSYVRSVRRLPVPVGRLRVGRRFGLRPLLIDRYVLNGFLFYFGVLLAALVALIASISILPSASNASIAPHAKAPCAPPPCKARLIDFFLAFRAFMGTSYPPCGERSFVSGIKVSPSHRGAE